MLGHTRLISSGLNIRQRDLYPFLSLFFSEKTFLISLSWGYKTGQVDRLPECLTDRKLSRFRILPWIHKGGKRWSRTSERELSQTLGTLGEIVKTAEPWTLSQDSEAEGLGGGQGRA